MFDRRGVSRPLNGGVTGPLFARPTHTFREGVGGWWLGGSAVDADFASQQYFGDEVGNIISVARATTTSYADNLDGSMTAFASGEARITDKGLLIEPQRTNSMVNPLAGSAGGGGTPDHSTFVANAADGPRGANTAQVITEDTSASTSHGVTFPKVTKDATARTFQWHWKVALKPGSAARTLRSFVWSGDFAHSFNWFANPTTGTMTVGSVTGMTLLRHWSVFVGTFNGAKVFEFFISFTTSTKVDLYLNMGLADASADPRGISTTATYTGDGASGVILDCRMLEEGTFPTSFVSGTRAADAITVGGALASAINAAEGSVLVQTRDGTSIGAARLLDSGGTVLAGYTSGNLATTALVATLSTANTANRIYTKDRVALSWDATGRRLVMNGGAAVTDSEVQTPSGTVTLGSDGSGGNYFSGYITRLTAWSSRKDSLEDHFGLVSANTCIGMGVAGPENLGGGATYYPTTSDWNYLQSKGFTRIRLYDLWEDIQPTMDAALDATIVAAWHAMFAAAAARNMGVMINIHNFGGRKISGTKYLIGSAQVPTASWADFMTRLATEFGGDAGFIGLGHNEPLGFTSPGSQWVTAFQGGVDAWRAVDSTKVLTEPGYGDSSTLSNGYNTKGFQPTTATNLGESWVEGHTYFDQNPAATGAQGGPGTYGSAYSAYGTDGYDSVRAMTGFHGYCLANGRTPYIGEFNTPETTDVPDTDWFPALDHALAYMVQNGIRGDACFYGANGAGSGANLSLNPTGAVDDARLAKMIGAY